MDRCLGRFLDTLEQTGLDRNTAVILTADHGTNLGERGLVYKGYPLHEQTARVPMFVSTPDGDSGRNTMIVQPQDIFATVTNLAGVKCPPELDSQDILALARDGKPGRREIALSGWAASAWHQKPTLFTAFTNDWYLEVEAKPETSRLTRMGTLDCIEKEHPDKVRELHAAALDELERRGATPELMAWLRGGGAGKLPQSCPLHADWPGPSGFMPYFRRLYGHEF